MGVVVSIGDEEAYTEVCAYNKYEPEQCRDTACAQCFAVGKYEDAIGSNETKDGS